MDTVITTAWVSIGRNVGDRPLDDELWDLFITDTYAALASIGSVAAEVSGTSTWEGQPEGTHLFLVEVVTGYVPVLRSRLARLAAFYDQEAIGFIGNTGTTLVLAQA